MSDLFSKRRSIRKYTDQPISEADLRAILTAGMNAPSGKNMQDCRYIVLTEKESLLGLISEVNQYWKMLETATAAIVVLGDHNINNNYEYICINASAAIENIIMKATELGIGSCWLGVAPHPNRLEGMKKHFNLPENLYPVGVVSLGYPDEVKEENNRYDESKIIIRK